MTVEQLMAILQQADPDAWVELEVSHLYGTVCTGVAEVTIVGYDTVTLTSSPPSSPKLPIFAARGCQGIVGIPGPNTTIGANTPTTQNANVRTATMTIAVLISNPSCNIKDHWHSGLLGCWPDYTRFKSFPSGWEASFIRRGQQETLDWYDVSGCYRSTVPLPQPLSSYTPQDLWWECGPFSQLAHGNEFDTQEHS